MNQKIYKTNQIFLITVLMSIAASMLPIYRLFPSYTARLLFSQIILAAPGTVYLLAGHRNYAEAVRLKRLRLGTVLWLVLFTVCVMPFMGMVNAISMLFVENVTSSAMNNIVSGNSYLLSMLLIALLPCVLEESVYRGLFYNEYRKVSPLRGMLLSALLFGLMHGNLNQFSYAFLMGITFAFVIEATDSILASMIMHFLINGFSTTMMALMSKLDDGLVQEAVDAVGDTETLAGVIRSYLPFAVIGLLCSLVVYRLIAASEGRLEYVNALFRLPKASRRRVEREALREIRRLHRGGETAEQNGETLEQDGEAAERDGQALNERNREKHLEYAGSRRSGERTRLITIPLIVGMALCAVVMILNEVL
ncbi:MAG: CPBP family intramembrane metalloprotease [Lachnospiraceae bacterium]|nr:CPBP family intramembrane metalloprotease [Lachnospiraceae bacterium]